jgi:hypothetical protein
MKLHDTFHQIIDVAEAADKLSSDLAVLLRPVSYSNGKSSGEPLHPEIVAGFHRVQCAARDLARNAAEALTALSPATLEAIKNG